MKILDGINQYVVNPIIILLFACAFIYFLWGVFLYIKNAASEDDRATGKRHIVYGVIGMAIMFGAKAIVAIISSVVGGY